MHVRGARSEGDVFVVNEDVVDSNIVELHSHNISYVLFQFY